MRRNWQALNGILRLIVDKEKAALMLAEQAAADDVILSFAKNAQALRPALFYKEQARLGILSISRENTIRKDFF